MSGWKARDSIYLAVPGVSPHVEWALNQRAGRRYLRRGNRGDWLPVLIELNGISVDNLKEGVTADGERFVSDDEDDDTLLGYWGDALRIPQFLRELERRYLNGVSLGFVTAYAYQPRPLGEWQRGDKGPAGFFDLLGANTNPLMQKVISRVTIGLTLPKPARARSLGGAPMAFKESLEIEAQRVGKAVVMGVIDDAIAVANDRFVLAPSERGGEEMTRVKFAWIQDGDHEERHGVIVEYGAEITAPMINLAREESAEESERYRALRILRFDRAGSSSDPDRGLAHKGIAHRTAHGTHVLDAMAGAAPRMREVARPIVSVQLPAATTANTAGPDFDQAMLDGVLYILYRAAMGFASPGTSPLPVVINCSYGYLGGPNDGTSAVEVALDSLLGACRKADWPVALVLPSGNSHLAGCHAAIPTGRGTHTLGLIVQPDDHTPSAVELWLPCSTDEDVDTGTVVPLTLVVKPPSGPAHEVPAVVGRVVEWLNDDGEVLCQVSCVRAPAPNLRVSLMLTLQPTASLDGEPLAPSGTWQLTLIDDGLSAGEHIHAWVGRDDSLRGHPRRGRQARFADSEYVRFDGPDGQGRLRVDDDEPSLIQRGGSQNAIATGREPLVVGAARAKEPRDLSPYSAGGPLPVACGDREGMVRTGPDLAAIADDSAVHRGVLAAGSANGSRVLMDGTSAAAPRVARLLADEIVNQIAIGTAPNQVVDAAKAALGGMSRAAIEAPARAGKGVLSTSADEQESLRRVGALPG